MRTIHRFAVLVLVLSLTTPAAFAALDTRDEARSLDRVGPLAVLHGAVQWVVERVGALAKQGVHILPGGDAVPADSSESDDDPGPPPSRLGVEVLPDG